MGTTYSGYSFSSRDEYKSNPNSQRSRQWRDPSNNHVSNKTSTCILFDPQGKFHSFGFEAEEIFYNLAEDNKQEDWYYFKTFKMHLYKRVTILFCFYHYYSNYNMLEINIYFSTSLVVAFFCPYVILHRKNFKSFSKTQLWNIWNYLYTSILKYCWFSIV